MEYMPLIWVENCVFLYLRPSKDVFISFGMQYGPNQASHLFVAQNCLFGGSAIARNTPNMSRLVVLRLQRNTFLGRSVALNNLSRVDITASENLVISDSPPLEINSSSVKQVQGYDGRNNAVWLTTRPLAVGERDKDLFGLFPGPLLKAAPQPEGTGAAKEPYRKYRLKKNQPSATLASDGGPAGIRSEYLPDLPSVPISFLQGR